VPVDKSVMITTLRHNSATGVDPAISVYLPPLRAERLALQLVLMATRANEAKWGQVGDSTMALSCMKGVNQVRVFTVSTPRCDGSRPPYNQVVKVNISKGPKDPAGVYLGDSVDLTPEEAIRMAHSLMEYANPNG